MTDVLLVADTHLDAAAAGRLTERTASDLVVADVVLHAGEITHLAVLDALAAHAPGHAVRGNNDRGVDLPERVVVTVEGCAFALVHDSGPATGRTKRLRRWFPHAEVVVFGPLTFALARDRCAHGRSRPAPCQPGVGDAASAGA